MSQPSFQFFVLNTTFSFKRQIPCVIFDECGVLAGLARISFDDGLFVLFGIDPEALAEETK